jgi:hypothetical protein
MGKHNEEANMPLLIPVLIGVPVLVAGSYFIITAWH